MLALTVIGRDKDRFEQDIRSDVVAKREIAAFRERISSVSSIEDLMGDYEVYSFVMKAHGLEDEMPSKAMIRKIMTSDASDSSSLVRKLTNGQFTDLNKTMGFSTEGIPDSRFGDEDWIDGMVDKFVEQRLIDNQMASNETVGVALDFDRKSASMTNWYKVLADADFAAALRVALGIPSNVATADIDKQKQLFERKMDIADLQDPEKVGKLLTRYAAISDANSAGAVENNPAVMLLQAATNSGTWSLMTLDVDLVSGFNPGALR